MWPLVLFYTIINMAGINAFVVYASSSRTDSCRFRSKSLKEVALNLVRDDMAHRSQDMGIKRDIRTTAQNLLRMAAQPSTSVQQTV